MSHQTTIARLEKLHREAAEAVEYIDETERAPATRGPRVATMKQVAAASLDLYLTPSGAAAGRADIVQTRDALAAALARLRDS